MAKHPSHTPGIDGEPPCRDEAAHHPHQCLISLVRLLGRHAAQALVKANRADFAQTSNTETSDDA